MARKGKSKYVVCERCGLRSAIPIRTPASKYRCQGWCNGTHPCGGKVSLWRNTGVKKAKSIADPTPADLKAADVAAAASHFQHEPKMVYEAIVEIRMYLDGSADPERYVTMRCSTDDPGTLEEFLDNIGTAKASMDT